MPIINFSSISTSDTTLLSGIDTLYSGISELVINSETTNTLLTSNNALLGSPVAVEFLPTYTDLFGKLRTSNSNILGSVAQIFDNNATLLDTSIGAGGSSVWTQARASTLMTTGTGSGSTIIRQTKRYFLYKTAHSLQFYITFSQAQQQAGVVKRIGAFDANNGCFLEITENDVALVIRSSVTGSPVDRRYLKANWNVDTYSTADWSKSQLLLIEWAWLGVDGVRFSFVVDGDIEKVHEQFFSNAIEPVYMSTPHLPLRWEVGTVAEVATAGELEQICGSCIRNGGDTEANISTAISSAATTALTATTTARTALSFRLRSTHARARLEASAVELTNTGTGVEHWWLVLNPTVTGEFTWANAGIIAESSLSQLTYTDGTGLILASGFVNSSAQTKATVGKALANYLAVVSNIAGTSDICSLVVQGSGTINIHASIDLAQYFI